MPFLTMNNYRFGKLDKRVLITRGRVLFLLLCMALPAGQVTAAEPDAVSAQNQVETSATQGQSATPPVQDPSSAPLQADQQTVDLTAVEEENSKVADALEELLESMQLGNFEYQVEERPDPFMPFISERIIQSTDSDSENGEKLTGMRQLEPGQLTLAAILFTEVNPIAMVEDSSHRGYVIRRGTRIGKFGIVTDILPNAVIIKQLSYSMSQEKKYTTVEMILRKEGEK